MKIQLSFIVFLSTLLAHPSLARESGEKGNGGDAVVCYADAARTAITSIDLFDYWEQDQVLTYPGGIQLGDPSLTVQQKIDLALDRVGLIDVDQKDAIRRIAMGIANHIGKYVVTKSMLPEIENTTPLAVPKAGSNCFIEQFAVQWKDVTTGQRRFAISEHLFNHARTSNDVRAGLILHEAIYRTAIQEHGVTNSDGTRYYNYVIATQFLESDSFNRYVAVLDAAEFNPGRCALVHYSNALFDREVYVKDSPDLTGKILCLPLRIELPKMKLSLKKEETLSLPTSPEFGLWATKGGTISFEKADKTWTTTPANTAFINLNFTVVPTPPSYWPFDRNPSVFSVQILGVQDPAFVPEIVSGPQVLKCGTNFPFELTGDGTVIGCAPKEDSPFIVNGSSILLAKDFKVRFDDQERLWFGYLATPAQLEVQSSAARSFWFKANATLGTLQDRAYPNQESLVFDVNGKVTGGALLAETSVPTPQGPAYFHEITLSWLKVQSASFRTTFPARYLGKRIGSKDWRYSDSKTQEFLQSLCIAQGYPPHSLKYRSSPAGEQREEYIEVGETFADSRDGSEIYAADEPMWVYDDYVCEKKSFILL